MTKFYCSAITPAETGPTAKPTRASYDSHMGAQNRTTPSIGRDDGQLTEDRRDERVRIAAAPDEDWDELHGRVLGLVKLLVLCEHMPVVDVADARHPVHRRVLHDGILEQIREHSPP